MTTQCNSCLEVKDTSEYYDYAPFRCKSCASKIIGQHKKKARDPSATSAVCYKCGNSRDRDQFTVSKKTGVLNNNCEPCRTKKFNVYDPARLLSTKNWINKQSELDIYYLKYIFQSM